MVSAPSADGRSLNQAVKKNIDVSTARFERGFANLALDGGRIEVANGVVRGTDVGATFQGIVRDPDGQINMTGTFMPAYGLKPLFGELPLIGTLLAMGAIAGCSASPSRSPALSPSRTSSSTRSRSSPRRLPQHLRIPMRRAGETGRSRHIG